ncbi:hypothetical protein [Planomicrobium sp. CPCC 101110]|uniref:hypothetical protein n=1 Tax=Planomicrobium sp. CPCC 101110 TaxID=2599619 RepID=UPI0011B75CB9|nr:hypothetical protein [Planomicrobium sp. CPCC 101110]TWT25426.1 hypothetical protein FQV30_13815 [Planomicrobium sp. CPCC 101110]
MVKRILANLFATKQQSDATLFHVSKLAQRCRNRSNGFKPCPRKASAEVDISHVHEPEFSI